MNWQRVSPVGVENCLAVFPLCRIALHTKYMLELYKLTYVRTLCMSDAVCRCALSNNGNMKTINCVLGRAAQRSNDFTKSLYGDSIKEQKANQSGK